MYSCDGRRTRFPPCRVAAATTIAVAIVMVAVNENTCNKYVHGIEMLIEKAIVTAGGLLSGRRCEDSYRGVSAWVFSSLDMQGPLKRRMPN